MANAIDICNMALAHLGDSASISSIAPPEGSVQAHWCSIMYPQAVRTLLDSPHRHNWSFNTKRATLPQLVNSAEEYAYCFALPSDFLSIIQVRSSGQVIDSFSLEVTGDNTQCLLTDADSVVLKYAASITDPGIFPPLFVDALSLHLAARLAGPILKGDVGVAAATKLEQLFDKRLMEAINSDLDNFRDALDYVPEGIAARA